MKQSDEEPDVQVVAVVWGNATQGKADLREASLAQHLAKPISERLLAALSMVQRVDRDEPQ